jgi:hypothetical protein
LTVARSTPKRRAVSDLGTPFFTDSTIFSLRSNEDGLMFPRYPAHPHRNPLLDIGTGQIDASTRTWHGSTHVHQRGGAPSPKHGAKMRIRPRRRRATGQAPRSRCPSLSGGPLPRFTTNLPRPRLYPRASVGLSAPLRARNPAIFWTNLDQPDPTGVGARSS